MVVHHPDGLHVCVDDRRADEAEPAALQILAHGVRLDGRRRNLAHGSPAVPDRAAVDEAPLVRIEAAELRLDFEKGPGVPDRRFDLGPVAHDPGVRQERRDFAFVVAGPLLRVEPAEGTPVGVALPEDGDPAQPRLRSLEDEEFEKAPVVVDGNAPFLVVIRDVERVGARPRASVLLVVAHSLFVTTVSCGMIAASRDPQEGIATMDSVSPMFGPANFIHGFTHAPARSHEWYKKTRESGGSTLCSVRRTHRSVRRADELNPWMSSGPSSA